MILLYDLGKSVGSSVLRAFFASNACFTRNEPSTKRLGGVGLGPHPPKLCSFVMVHSAESRPSYSKRSRCRKNVIIPRTVAICHRMIHAAGGRD